MRSNTTPRAQAQASLTIIVEPALDRNGRRMSGHYTATLDGRRLIAASRQPFFDAARTLIDEGAAPGAVLVMQHAGSATDSLKARIGVAARLTVKERANGRMSFEAWEPLSSSPVPSPMRSESRGVGQVLPGGAAILAGGRP